MARKERLAVRDDSDPRDLSDRRDPNHIWLRQSVTFTVNGQTRTLEMALPLRPGATPDEVESLLDEADAGMRRLSRRLDAHLAEVNGSASAHEASPAASQPAMQRPPERSAAPAGAAATPRAVAPVAPASPAASQPRNLTPAAPASAAPAGGGPDLTRAQFMTEIAALGLDARMAMERLQTRTLNGLNLREALEALRRQMIREGGAPAPADISADISAAAPVAAPADLPAPIGVARFDEEDEEGEADEFELSYPDADDLPGEDDYAAEDDFAPLEVPASAAPASRSAKSAASRAPAGPLGDVPDLDDLLSPAPVAAPTAPATSAHEMEEAEGAEDALVVRARELIVSLRAAHGGGQPTEHQRSAYKNIVVDQLGETKAAGVARALWRLTPERLGPEQLDALVRWGKEDAFVEEVEAVLDLLRAEYRAQQAQQAQQQGQQQGQRSPTASGRPGAAPAPVSPPVAPAPRRTASHPAEQAGGADEPRQGAPSEPGESSEASEATAPARAATRGGRAATPRASRDSQRERSDHGGAPSAGDA